MDRDEKIELLKKEMESYKKSYTSLKKSIEKLQNSYMVGDVVIKREGFTSIGNMDDSDYGGNGWGKFPKIFEIERVEDNSVCLDYPKMGKQIIWMKGETGNSYGIFSHCLRLADEETAIIFKRGLPKIGDLYPIEFTNHIKYGEFRLPKDWVKECRGTKIVGGLALKNEHGNIMGFGKKEIIQIREYLNTMSKIK